MLLQRYNNSFYRYEATFHVWYKDKTEEIKEVNCDTDILYNQLHFWNKKRIIRKYKTLMVEKMARDGQMVMCELIQDDLVLISRISYLFID